MILGIPGGMQVVLIIVVVLLLFGGRKIPELMKGLGKGIKEFKDASNSVEEDTASEDKK
ncbi:MAG: twin-arginine translocase TatA/TatE family subunit [Lishizhenia sp.]